MAQGTRRAGEMNEAQWLASTDPEAMLTFLRGTARATGRKLRLFAPACCRRIWHLLADQSSRAAVELAERLADGEAGREGLDVAAGAEAAEEAAGAAARAAGAAEGQAQAALLRDIFGPLPFRPLTPLSPSLLAWNDGLVVRLARSAYEGRILPSGHLELERLAVLADAFEEAGCAEPDLLAHLRGSGPHVRGCWAVDAVLGKS
jgi:hypothetical protein